MSVRKTYGPHRGPADLSIVSYGVRLPVGIFQLIGGKNWSLALVRKKGDITRTGSL